jgi:hypothetical protein
LREPVPIEQCEAVISCVPESCRRCGGLVRPDESQPIRHQVWEIPRIEPTVIEYQLPRGHCDCCGITSLAELPCGVPRGQCGPRLAAFTGLLMGAIAQDWRTPAKCNYATNVIFYYARIDRADGIRASDGDALDCKRFRCT